MDKDLILRRLADRAADLAEAQVAYDYWLKLAEDRRLVSPRRGYRLVADGQGSFIEEPIPSFDLQAGG